MHQRFMEKAIELAIENARLGNGGPFAALVVSGGSIVAQGVNQVTSRHDPTAHAEIVAIREACAALGQFQLPGCEIYASCEPCPMCLGAVYWARLDRVFFAATRADAAAFHFDDDFIYQELQLPLESRRIPMVPLLPERGLEAFRRWEQQADKTPY